MIDIQIRQYRGCDHADLSVDPMVLLGGKNGAGKTSIAQAVAAVLSGVAVPVRGLAKRDIGKLLRDGASHASVTIRSEAGTACLTWPAGEIKSEGTPPHATQVAAGISSIAEMVQPLRARAFAELLHTDPDRVDLARAMGDVGHGETAIGIIWKLIEEQGWDGAWNSRKERGAEMKGEWRAVTGQTYGSVVGARWAPPFWTEDLETATEQDLDAAADAARTAHHQAIAQNAVSAERRAVLAAEAGAVEARRAAVDVAAQALAGVEGELEGLEQARHAMPRTDQETPKRCPGCGMLLVRDEAHDLAPAPAPLSTAELKRARLKIADLDGSIANCRTRIAAANQTLFATRAALGIAQQAASELAELPPETGLDVDAAGAALATAIQRVVAFNSRIAAAGHHQRIASNELVINILGPEGERARKLGRVLEHFNAERLLPLCDAAGWRRVEVSPDMEIKYGGRPYTLLSASEQYRVRAVLQIAAAVIDGSSMVVLDAADILDTETRLGLFDILTHTGMPALVGMTLPGRHRMPPMAPDQGQALWVEAGIAEPVPPHQAAA